MLMVAVTALAFPGLTGVAEDQWGHLTGGFVYDGERPVPRPIEVSKDQRFCGKHNLIDETLLVGADTGIRHVAVWLHTAGEHQRPVIHSSFRDPEKAVLRFEDCRFEPHMLAIRPGQELELYNGDPLGHNANLTTLDPRNIPPGVLVPYKRSYAYRFRAEESMPVRVVCNIHPWMKGYIVVKDHPYVGITDESGTLQIQNLPAGVWTFKVWQERSGWITRVRQNQVAVNWTRGEVKVHIKPGETLDLGDVFVDPANFEK